MPIGTPTSSIPGSRSTVVGATTESEQPYRRLDEYVSLTPSDAVLVERSRQKLLNGCTAKEGLTPDRLDLEKPESFGLTSGNATQPQFIDPAIADVESVGYLAEPRSHSATQLPAAARPPPIPLSDAEQGTVNRCAAEAYERLHWEPYADYVNHAAVYTAELEGEARQDPGYLHALDGWRTCMGASGYSFADPQTAYEAARPPGGFSDHPASTIPKQAQIDYACQRTERLRETKKREYGRQVADWLESHPTFVADGADIKQ